MLAVPRWGIGCGCASKSGISRLESGGDTPMRFRLTYEGSLKSSQDRPAPGKTDRRAAHKHELRRHFHKQLRHFFETDKFLSGPHFEVPRHLQEKFGVEDNTLRPRAEVLPHLYEKFGYRFVPLVRDEEFLSCSLRILLLRRDPPGSIYNRGDIDNRIKTVLDALRQPANAKEVSMLPAGIDEDPFFVLLEDDSQVTHLEVETDRLLVPTTRDADDSATVHLVISVDVRPYFGTFDNGSFL